MRVQKRIAKGCQVLEYYANNKWIFHNSEMLELRKLMNPTEMKKYICVRDTFDCEEYVTDCVRSIRRYMLNEPDETIPACKRHMMV